MIVLGPLFINPTFTTLAGQRSARQTEDKGLGDVKATRPSENAVADVKS